MAMRAQFAQEDAPHTRATVRLCEAIVGLLTGGEGRH